MALFKLVFSILLLSLVCSAPVEVPAETNNKGYELVATVSDTEKNVKPSTKSDLLTSSRGILTSSPIEQSDLHVEKGDSESLKPTDSVPTSIANEEQSSSDAIPIERDSSPLSDLSVVTRTSEQEDDQQNSESENTHHKDSNLEVDATTSDTIQQGDEASLPADINRDIQQAESSSDNRPEDSEASDGIPVPDTNQFDIEAKDAPSVLDEPDIPPQIADRDEIPGSIGSSQEPYGESPLDQTPFDEEGPNEGPQSPTNDEAISEEKVIQQPPELTPEDEEAKQINPEITEEDFSEIQNEPQNSAPISTGDISAENEPSQIEDRGPTDIVQPEGVGPSFETYDDPTVESEDDTRLPTPDQNDNPDGQEDNGPGTFPMNVDAPEEMVGDPIELPIKEDPPVILVRDDLVPPMLSVIQMDQQVPQYGNREILPLRDDSPKGESPEEEISNSENPGPEALNFDNRPDESGPMNIL